MPLFVSVHSANACLCLMCLKGAYIDHGIPATTSMSFGKKDNYSETGKLEEEMSEKNENIVSSLAEKAMSVAGPAVPMKEGGGLDQERSDYYIFGLLYILSHCVIFLSLLKVASTFSSYEQVGGNVGRMGAKGWHVEAGW